MKSKVDLRASADIIFTLYPTSLLRFAEKLDPTAAVRRDICRVLNIHRAIMSGALLIPSCDENKTKGSRVVSKD